MASIVQAISHPACSVIMPFVWFFTLYLTICSTMIDINQWRASIGAFNISRRSVSYTNDTIGCDCLEFMEYEVFCMYHYFPIVCFLSVYYALNVFFQMFLILSGDIETNPGPVKTCPSCDAQIHIKKKICMCGYAFNQNYKQLIRCLSMLHLPKVTLVP